MRTVRLLLIIYIAALTVACGSETGVSPRRAAPLNPYENVNWPTVSHYRADLHVHTIQSDGCHLLEEVVQVYHDAGFSILAITDHDTVPPNGCAEFVGKSSPYPDPQPANFPADTTWPWTDYGAPPPAELDMLGIEGVELTAGHHRNAFFIDYGVIPESDPSISEQLNEVGRRGGLAVINHPESRFKEWYHELLRDHSADYLVGIEISRDVDYATAVWDQLLGDLMPSRPVWGFATSDMHAFMQTPFAFTVFLLDELTTDAVKEAMQTGQFYSVVGPGTIDPRETGRGPYDGTYPELRSVVMNAGSGEISIKAANYDEIVWISGTPTWRFTLDPQRGVTWPPGEIVQRGATFRYADSERALRYVRAELIRQSENGPIRVLLNPFALPAANAR